MGDNSKIQWTEATWNPIVGCGPAGSPGCENCYAARDAARLATNPNPKLAEKYAGLTDLAGQWTGQIRLWEPALKDPLRWRRPRVIFVGSMTDLCHPCVENAWIDQILDIIHSCPQHRFLILTKRPHMLESRLYGFSDDSPCRFLSGGDYIPNLGIGVTVCNQAEADAKIPILFDTPAAMRFISIEPMLGGISLKKWMHPNSDETTGMSHRGLDWVIVGGETGKNARPMHPDWARSVRDQCQAAGVPFFFKQWGEWQNGSNRAGGNHIVLNNGRYAKLPENFDLDTRSHWNDYRPVCMAPVGKKRAGRLLDGREWNERPEWFFGGEDNHGDAHRTEDESEE